MLKKSLFSLIENIHRFLIFNKRVEILSRFLADLLLENNSVLDIGSGDGLVAKTIMERKPGIKICGIDVIVRQNAYIPIKYFDGRHIPFPNDRFDTVMLIDVLHHTINPLELLRESGRVAKYNILIKDHIADFSLRRWALILTDWIANRPYGVPLPFNFQTLSQWKKIFNDINFKENDFVKLDMYPFPFNFNSVLNWSRDFIVKLEKRHL